MGAAVYLLIMSEDTKVASPGMPLVVIAATTYLIGSSMMAVYGMTIDTMLVCFVCDEEMHDNSPVYTDEGLSFVTKKNEEAKAEGIDADGDAEGSESQLQVQKV